MTYDPNRRQRRSIRLRGYDYRQPGAYFVTICTHGRQPWFGAFNDHDLALNDAGRMVVRWWQALHQKFPAISADAFVVMPDHIHGIIVIAGPGDVGHVDVIAGVNAGGYANLPLRNDIDDSNASNAGNDRAGAGTDDDDANVANDASTSVGADGSIRPRRNSIDRTVDNAAGDRAAVSLSRAVQWFKIMTTTEYIRHVKQSAWPAFDRRVWQRGYYEHIVRDEGELDAVRRYIAANPARGAERRDDIDALLARMEERR